MKFKVLLLDGGGTQTLPIAKSLYKKEHAVHIFYEHKLTYGYGTRYAECKIQSPSIYDEKNYTAFFKEYVLRKCIDVVIPMSDPSAVFLSKNKHLLLQFCKFIAPDYDTFMLGYDKNKLMTVCKENNFPHPSTIDVMTTDIASIHESFFPALLKPNITTGGRGMKIINTKPELEMALKKNINSFGPCHLQKLVSEGGRQFKVELFLDNNHQLINSSVIHKIRFYPITGGSSCFNITTRNDDIVNLCYCVLKKIAWIGFADFDLIEDPGDGIIKIMEINPRIPACIKSAIESGIDYGNMIVEAAMGENIKEYIYKPEKQLRHIGFDILWFVHSKNRFKSKPNWLNFVSKSQSFQDFSISDPMPFFYGTIGNIKKMFNEDFRKSKNKY